MDKNLKEDGLTLKEEAKRVSPDKEKEINKDKDIEVKGVPKIESHLRNTIIEVPEVINNCSGIIIKGRKIKSVLYSTDVAIIRNCNADAVIAVYPFTPELTITKAILDVATMPVFCGVGGGTTTGKRSIDIAFNAESFGAYAVVLNSPTVPDIFRKMRDAIDIPIIATVSSDTVDYMAKVHAGASILNVSAGKNTAPLVRKIRKELGEDFPILATGGQSEESILETIKAGANAISYTPKTSGELVSDIMKKYRE